MMEYIDISILNPAEYNPRLLTNEAQEDVNDADWQADLLAKRLKGAPAHVNLIPLNEVEESPLKPSRRVASFQKRLEGHGVTVTVRRKLGGDIDASCGQLRRKEMNETQEKRG